MTSKLARADRVIVRLAGGTVKQQNLLMGTEVWTAPGHSNRPLATSHADHNPIDYEADGHHRASCSGQYLKTPLKESRLVRHEGGSWEWLDALDADQLGDTVAESRRIPSLSEIVSYSYWHLSHGHIPPKDDRRRMAHYLISDAGYERVINVVRSCILASGMSEGRFATTGGTARSQSANGSFSGGYSSIIGRCHFVDGVTEAHQLAGPGALTPDEHERHTVYTAHSTCDLYDLDSTVRYIVTFQN